MLLTSRKDGKVIQHGVVWMRKKELDDRHASISACCCATLNLFPFFHRHSQPSLFNIFKHVDGTQLLRIMVSSSTPPLLIAPL